MPQQFADDPLFESKIEFYAITINELKQLFNNILINVDLSENSDLSELLSNYPSITAVPLKSRSII